MPNLLLSSKIALKYIFSKKSHSAVNLISIVAVCGVVVASMAMVCVLSVFNGFHGLVAGKLSMIDPDLKIEASKGKAIINADSVLSVVRSVKGVELAIPSITDLALAHCGDKQMPVIVKGVTEQYDSLTRISGIIKSDGAFALHGMYGEPYAVISVGTALTLETRPGYRSPIALYAPKRVGRVNLSNPIGAFRSDTMAVSGVFQVDQLEYDNNMVIVPIETARRLFDYPEECTEIEIRTGADAAGMVKAGLEKRLGSGFVVLDRLMQHDSLFRLINVEKWITFLLLSFILVIAAFNVISTVSVLVVEKDDDISILRNLGASREMIIRIFSLQGLFITVIGSFIGVFVGLLLCLVQEYFGVIKLDGTPGTLVIDAYPVIVEASDIFTVLGMAMLVGMAASLITYVVMHVRMSHR